MAVLHIAPGTTCWGRRILLEERIESVGENHPRAHRWRRQLNEMEAYIKDREENWRDTYCHAAEHPTTQVVMVVEGV